MVILALTLVAMLIIAAFAIDLGAVYGERRVNQTSADSAATSGAVQFLRTQSSQSAVTEVIAKVNTDLHRTVPVGDWTSCSDANQLANTAAELSLVPATACISFSGGFTRMRVRLPDQVVETSLAGVIGIDSFTSSAFAEVNISPRGGGALPFVVLSGTGAGDQICLRTDGTGSSEPPDQPAIPPYTSARELDPCNRLNFLTHEGGRGTIKPYMYEGCNKPTGNQSIVDAILAGMDHTLGVFEPEVVHAFGADANATDISPNARLDGANSCQTLFPNTVDVDTGLTAQALRCGLLEVPCPDGSSATTGKSGRLTGPPLIATFSGLGVDDTPLWTYLVGTMPVGAPTACSDAKTIPATGANFYTRRAALRTCLEQWTPSVGQIFTSAIADQRRLGFVPQIAESCLNRDQTPPSCSRPLDNVHINGFAPVYLDGLYLEKGGTCDTTNPATPTADSAGWSIHYPGKGMKCGSANFVHRLSGVVIPCGSLPQDVCDPSSSSPFADPFGINSVRLSK